MRAAVGRAHTPVSGFGSARPQLGFRARAGRCNPAAPRPWRRLIWVPDIRTATFWHVSSKRILPTYRFQQFLRSFGQIT